MKKEANPESRPTGQMNHQRTSTKLLIVALIVCAVWLFAGCSEPSAKDVAAQYTEQTARAIIEGSWKIAGAIFFAAIVRGVLNK